MRMKYSYRLRRMANLCRDAATVLDVGWAGIPNPFLCNESVIGLDLTIADQPSNYTRCLVGNALCLPEPFGSNTFDALVAGELLEHLETPVDFLRRCHRVLAPSGRLILSTPNPHYPIEQLLTIVLSRKYFYTRNHVCLYPQRWLIRMMELAGFTDIRLYSGGILIPFYGDLPFPRPWCHQTIALGIADK
jgi:SAM-dependent methyltransferase